MISKNTIKHIHSLGLKKYRDELGCFVAEGPKVVGELLPLFPCRQLFATFRYWEALPPAQRDRLSAHFTEITEKELERLSLLRSPHEALALFDLPSSDTAAEELIRYPQQELCLALDGVQDPGNVGTILRLADWFGIGHIFASPATADVFSPKVVQATMGAVGRVKVHYVELPPYLALLPSAVPVYGTFLQAPSLYDASLSATGLVVVGNEGRGISPAVEALVKERIYIPPFPPHELPRSESLNVAMAAAVICSEFRRRQAAC